MQRLTGKSGASAGAGTSVFSHHSQDSVRQPLSEVLKPGAHLGAGHDMYLVLSYLTTDSLLLARQN